MMNGANDKMEKKSKKLSIYEVQQIIAGKNSKQAGKLLSGEKCGNWCGLWFDWFCEDKDLPKEAAKVVTFINGLSGEWIKKHEIWLKNNSPFNGDLYTDIRISPLTGKHFNIGYSLGNGDTRERHVFDTRIEGEIKEYKVKNNKEAFELVNTLMKG